MADRPYWADLHNHNGVGYGAGSLERSYRIARGSRLDVFCFTPHGRWHDMPADDPKMADFHRVGFELVRQQWERIEAAADEAYEPGRFVTFHGFEWHSSRFGDYHLLRPERVGELFAGDTVAELQAFARQRGAIIIPHHVGYRAGWRGADWSSFDPDLSPVVDVFSEHGCSMELEFNAPMLRHSMGGVERSQTVMARLAGGLVAGVVASTDNHFGHPGSYGEGLTGVWADELTRESVFDAIRRRHTYAVTGDRLAVALHLGEAMMGDVADPDAARVLRYHVDALGAIDYVRIVKNGRPVLTLPPPVAAGGAEAEFVGRVEFGWDAMTSREVTDWDVRVVVEGGRVSEVVPCFAGGAGSVEKLNRIESVGDREVAFSAFTSRLNARPTSAVVLRLAGDTATRLRVQAQARWRGEACGCELSASVAELLRRDEWAAVSGVFSAPKICLGRLLARREAQVVGQWTDPDPGDEDWYLLKVQQANGHAAWSSPIWSTRRET